MNIVQFRSLSSMTRRLVSVLLLVSIVLVSFDLSAGRIRNQHLFEEGDKYRFEVGGHEFKVDKGYVKGSSQSYFGILSSVSLWALLPNFEPYDKEKNRKEFVDQLGHGRRMWINLHPKGEGRVSLKKLFENGQTNNFDLYSGKLGEYDDIMYDLEVYRSHIPHWDDEYLYYPSGDIEVILKCSTKAAHYPSPGCTLYWDYSDMVFVEADFSKKYLPQWRSIVTNIKRLLDGQTIEYQGE
jgi:hypothetical protein